MSDLFVPKPENWTIRFKHGKSTILLHVNPEDSMLKVKQHLLNILNDLPSSSMLVESLGKIPSSPKDIIFGLPVDKNDLEQGWVPQIIPQDELNGDVNDEDTSDGEDQSVLNRNCSTAGLRDGAVMAFRFKDGGHIEEGDWGVEIPKLYEDEEDEDDMKEEAADDELNDEDMEDAK